MVCSDQCEIRDVLLGFFVERCARGRCLVKNKDVFLRNLWI